MARRRRRWRLRRRLPLCFCFCFCYFYHIWSKRVVEIYKMPSVLAAAVRFGCAKRQRKKTTHTHRPTHTLNTLTHTHTRRVCGTLADCRVQRVGCVCVFVFFFSDFFFGVARSFFIFCFSLFLLAFLSTQHTRDSRQLVLVENNPQWVIAVLPTQPFPPVRFTFFNLLCVF